MKLDLRTVVREPGSALPFAYELDLTGLDWNGGRPVTKPVAVTGEVRNKAGALFLNAALTAELSLVCDRCAKPFSRIKTVEYEALVSPELEDKENDEIVCLPPNSALELDELLTQVFILNLDTKNLCSEDCKGLCPGCGADLNHEVCRCRKEIDPRLAKLAELLEQD